MNARSKRPGVLQSAPRYRATPSVAIVAALLLIGSVCVLAQPPSQAGGVAKKMHRVAGARDGIEATPYFINHVLTNYGTDPEITKLVDRRAIYAKPYNNADGNTLYHLTAQTLRSTVRPYDEDGGETKSVTWQVKGTGPVTVTISSTRGGVDSKQVDVR